MCRTRAGNSSKCSCLTPGVGDTRKGSTTSHLVIVQSKATGGLECAAMGGDLTPTRDRLLLARAQHGRQGMPIGPRVTACALCAGLVAALLAIGGAASAAVPRSFASSTPAQVVGAAQVATTAAGSFVSSCSTQVPNAGLSSVTSTHIARSYGSQSQAVTVKGLGTGHLVVIFTGGVAYFKGDALALYIQFNAKNAKWANKWISVKKGQKDFTFISSGMTTSSAITQFTPAAPLRKSAVETYDGVTVVAVTGSVPASWQAGTGSARLYVATGAPHYAVAVTLAAKQSGRALTGKCTLSSWKRGFSVTKPASSTPMNDTGL